MYVYTVYIYIYIYHITYAVVIIMDILYYCLYSEIAYIIPTTHYICPYIIFIILITYILQSICINSYIAQKLTVSYFLILWYHHLGLLKFRQCEYSSIAYYKPHNTLYSLPHYALSSLCLSIVAAFKIYFFFIRSIGIKRKKNWASCEGKKKETYWYPLKVLSMK